MEVLARFLEVSTDDDFVLIAGILERIHCIEDDHLIVDQEFVIFGEICNVFPHV
jgi:hypothetical protein